MKGIIGLIIITVVGYLSAHFLFERLSRRFLLVSGIEYILLGVVIGPRGLNFLTPEMVTQLSPIFSLGVGWIGLLFGMQVRFRRLRRLDPAYFWITLIEAMTTFVIVGGFFGLAFWYGLGGRGQWSMLIPAAYVLGTTAMVTAPSAVALVKLRFRGHRYHVTHTLQHVIGFNNLLGIIVFGFLFCFIHVGETAGIRPLTAVEWINLSVMLGILLGILFHLLVRREHDENELLLALIGIVVYGSGIAYYLHLSPLFLNLIVGIVLTNLSPLRRLLYETLHSTERPFFIIFLIFVGAMWNIHAVWGYLLVPAYILVRMAAKFLGGYLAYLSIEKKRLLVPNVGWGLLSQGGVALALVVNYQQVYQNRFTDLVVCCILVSVIINELMSPRLARDFLADLGEITLPTADTGLQERTPTPTSPS